jgi:hypothetical protein
VNDLAGTDAKAVIGADDDVTVAPDVSDLIATTVGLGTDE